MEDGKNLKIDNYVCVHNSENPLPILKRSIRYLLKFHQLAYVNKIKVIKKAVLKELGLPQSTKFNKGFSLTSGKLFLGENVDLADTIFLDYAPVFIGNNVSFSYKNIVITSTHDIDNFNNVIVKPIIINDNVWITTNVTILAGVTIGANSIIGAGSVVTSDIASGCFAAGNPCRVIKIINFKK